MNSGSFDTKGHPDSARLFPIPGLVMFPHVMQPLHVFEHRYRAMLADALKDDQLIALPVLAARDERQARDINLALLKQAVTPQLDYTIPMEELNIAKRFAHKKIGAYEQNTRDWEPGDIVSVSRPGKNAGHLSLAHIYRVRPTTADIIWVEPVSGREIQTTEDLNELIFIRHDFPWRKAREDAGERLEAEEFNAGFVALNHKELGYDTMDYGYPTELIPNELDYEMFFNQNARLFRKSS